MQKKDRKEKRVESPVLASFINFLALAFIWLVLTNREP